MTTTKWELEPAFVIHTRAYRDTSSIINFLTCHHGVMGAVARGVRQKKSRWRGLIHPFVPVLITVQGRGSLKTLIAIEADGAGFALTERRLYSGLYLNELLLRLLPEWDAHPGVYATYRWALDALASGSDLEVVLRQFENRLLAELGVAVSWQYEALSGEAIDTQAQYRLDTEAGFVRVASGLGAHSDSIAGQLIEQVARGQWQLEGTKALAKQVNRALLKPLLGHKPLHSRRLFV